MRKMKIKIIIGVLFLLLGICETQAQRLKNKDWKERKELAREQIKSLYEGVLVFRLKTRSKNIDALRLNGKNKLADKIQKRQDTLNHRIYKAFQTHFNFCRVEFFFSDQSQKFRDNQVDEVHFLNQNLSIDSTIKLNDQYFLTSDIGILEQDTSWVTGRRYLSENENGTEYASRYSGGTNMRFHALKTKKTKALKTN